MVEAALTVPLAGKRQDDLLMTRLMRSRRGIETPDAADEAIVARLRDGDESAFMELIDRYGATMLRVAQMYVKDRASAEEVVQETWLAVLNGIDRFEGRSSLKTWLFRILTNRAKTRGERDRRMVPFSAIATAEATDSGAAVDPDRFLAANHPSTPYAWANPPRAWTQERVIERE